MKFLLILFGYVLITEVLIKVVFYRTALYLEVFLIFRTFNLYNIYNIRLRLCYHHPTV